MPRLVNVETGRIIYDPSFKIQRIGNVRSPDVRCYDICLSDGSTLTCSYEELKILKQMLNYVLYDGT